ncbi:MULTISPECIES: GTP-binding protein [Saccharopolyspora]
MVFASSDQMADDVAPKALKIVVAGGFGVGKTTLVGSVSEIAPLRTEAMLTDAGTGVDDLSGIEQKKGTTVALDFGRITITPQIVLYLFGTPGQDRFWFMWNELAQGAIGAVVLVDTRRVEASFPAVDFFERRAMPFVVLLNRFDGAPPHGVEEVRQALDLDASVPIVEGDARQRESSKATLIALVKHSLQRLDGEMVSA